MLRSPKKAVVKPRPKLVRRYKLVFRRYRFDPRTSKIMDAHDYGHKAWPMTVKA
jgi:hypothetical protein